MSKNLSKFLIIPNDKNIDSYNFNSFILPLKDYSIGFDIYFNTKEINSLSNKYNIYIIINKFLHKDEIKKIEKIIKSLNNIKGYFIEDLGLTDIIDKDMTVINQNHIINNYSSINYLNKKGFKDIVVSNELTYHELEEIRNNTKSNLYYFYINKNIIMYSKRKLISNYNEFYNLKSKNNTYILNNSQKKLIIKEEKEQTIIYNYNAFCASKYMDVLKKYDFLIVNLSNMNKEESNIILNNISSNNLHELIKCDYYFLENDIKYKVKDI